jgi:hypothetical protein
MQSSPEGSTEAEQAFNEASAQPASSTGAAAAQHISGEGDEDQMAPTTRIIDPVKRFIDKNPHLAGKFNQDMQERLRAVETQRAAKKAQDSAKGTTVIRRAAKTPGDQG